MRAVCLPSVLYEKTTQNTNRKNMSQIVYLYANNSIWAVADKIWYNRQCAVFYNININNIILTKSN